MVNLSRVTQEQNTLTAEITITNHKANKSEWHKSLREPSIPLLQKMFNWVLKEGESPCSWREAAISVIPKEGKISLNVLAIDL